MKHSALLFGFLRLPFDFFFSFTAFLLAYKLRQISDFVPFVQFPLDLNIFPIWSQYQLIALIGSLLFISILGLSGSYSFDRLPRFGKEIQKIITGSLIWLMAIISYYFIIHEFPFSRLTLIYGWILMLTLVCFGRFILKLLQRLLLTWNIGQSRLLLIGNNLCAERIYKHLQKNPFYQVIGTLSNQKPHLKGPPQLGKTSDLKRIVNTHKIDEIIQTESDLTQTHSLDLLNFCRTHHLQYHLVPDLVEVQRRNIDTTEIAGLPILSFKPTPLEGWGKIIKRATDIMISLIGLIILSPLMLIIAILIKIDSVGPILFSRLENGAAVKRVGQHGQLFPFIKFRTMKPNTHHLRYSALASKNLRTDGPLVKIKNDPRVTKFGQFLRRTSLDELPQLWSVLLGHMSLIGPRPHLPEEVAKYQDYQKFVFEVRPGITGLAQISGRSDLEFDEEIRLDTYYIENWSLILDLKILLKTFFVIVKKYDE